MSWWGKIFGIQTSSSADVSTPVTDTNDTEDSAALAKLIRQRDELLTEYENTLTPEELPHAPEGTLQLVKRREKQR